MQVSFLALHIPDGFLSTEVAIIGWILVVPILAYALRQTKRHLGERQVPFLGVIAAFIFAAQAINFPVAAGTSGHLLGGALAAILLGPWAATVIMVAVIVIQALLFQDGGLVVMGWNIINMGVITSFTGYAAYIFIRRVLGNRSGSHLSGAFFGAWLSVVVAALATAIQLAFSGTVPLRLALPAMASVHILIGIGEAIITVGAVSLLLVLRPELVTSAEMAPGKKGAYFTVAGILLVLFVAALSPFASINPDGLEAVAAEGGFLQLGGKPVYEIFPGYVFPLIQNEAVATFLAVGVGAVIVFVISILIGRKAARPRGVPK